MGPTGNAREERERFRIVVRGEFGGLLKTAFQDVTVTTGGGKTELIAEVRDNQELYGLLDRLRDNGVDIEEVSQVHERD